MCAALYEEGQAKQWGVKNPLQRENRDYFMESARVLFLFTSWEVSENERVSAANEWVFWYASTSE